MTAGLLSPKRGCSVQFNLCTRAETIYQYNNILQYSVPQYGAMILVNIFVVQYIAIILALKTSKDHVFPLKTLIIFCFYMKMKDTETPYLTLF